MVHDRHPSKQLTEKLTRFSADAIEGLLPYQWNFDLTVLFDAPRNNRCKLVRENDSPVD